MFLRATWWRLLALVPSSPGGQNAPRALHYEEQLPNTPGNSLRALSAVVFGEQRFVGLLLDVLSFSLTFSRFPQAFAFRIPSMSVRDARRESNLLAAHPHTRIPKIFAVSSLV